MQATFFSAKSSRTLALTSCAPALIPAASIGSVRLGCGHTLRPPGAGLRCRRRSRSLSHFRARSPQFVVRASVDSGVIFVVIAVSTVSAITVAYYNHSDRKKKGSSDKLAPCALSSRQDVADDGLESRVPDFRGIQRHESVKLGEGLRENPEGNIAEVEESNQVQDPTALQGVTDHGLKSRFSDSRDTLSHGTVKLSKALIESAEDIQNSLVNEGHDQTSGPNILQNGSFSTLQSESAYDDFLLSGTYDSIFANDNGAAKLILQSPMLPGSASPHLPVLSTKLPDSSTKTPAMQLEQQKQNSHFVPNVPQPTMDCHHLGASSCSVDLNVLVDEKMNLQRLPFDTSESNSCDVTSKQIPSGGLQAFFGVEQSMARSLSATGMHAVYPSISAPNAKGFSCLNSVSEFRGVELSSDGPYHSIDNSNEKMPVALSMGSGSSHKKKESRRERKPLRDKVRRHLDWSAHKSMPQFPVKNAVPSDDKGHPSEKFGAYNHLLRNGRLAECIDMLEDMDESGQLDMDKIHHASFFKHCKNQRAVKEAFRFTKLVPNPTLSTFNMLMSVCACSQDTGGALQVLQLVQETGMRADCKLYTTLISTCAKSGKVDAMFEVFHEMVNSGVEPNVHTYGALIDGCARAGQVAKAFGAYGIMRSKNVKPDRVIFNALITACGESGVVDRAFDVLAEMRAETHPIDPDHITIGALMKACSNAGQVGRAKDVYKMIHEYNIKGTPEVYTIAVNCCSHSGDWEFACSIYSDMQKKNVIPDEVFFSAMIDVAGHAGMLDVAFKILEEAKTYGIRLGIISYSSLMGACCNAKNWQKALVVYEKIRSIKLQPTISTMNALITALCDGEQLPKAMELLSEMKTLGLSPNTITYSVLLMASERKDELDVGLALLSQAKEDGIAPNLVMYRCITGMCFRRYEKACALGVPVLSFSSGRPQIQNKWTSLALMVYREMILGGTVPTLEVISQVLGCLRIPHDTSLRNRLMENLGVGGDLSKRPNLCSILDGFGVYDLRAFSLFEEAAFMGILPCISFKHSPIVIDTRKLHIHSAEVYLLTVLKGLKHRLAAGAKLPSVNVILPIQETQITTPEGEKTINLSGRISQALGALLRRMGLPYQGNESYGKIRISGLTLRRWFRPKLVSPFREKEFKSSQMRLGRGIFYQQRNIRTGFLTLD